MTYTLGDIAKIVNAKLIGHKDFEIENLLYDSRRIIPSNKSLFFALRVRRDGHLFINQMIDRGVTAFVVEKPIKTDKKINFLIVDNSLAALQKLATYHRQQFKYPVLAITGSNGKTIVKDWISFLLKQNFNVVSSPKSFNSQIGVPLSIWQMHNNHQIGIFEAGISQPGEMEKLEKIIKPDIGIFTILGDAHQENFISLNHKLEEKLKLFKNCHTIIYPRKQKIVYNTIENIFSDRKLISWTDNKNLNADLKIYNINKKDNKTEIKAIYKNQNKISITIPMTDNASIHNAITSWLTVISILGIEKTQKLNFLSLPHIEMRLQQMQGINNTIIINDTYNCDFTSLQIALDYLAQQAPAFAKTLILSDIEQVSHKPKKLYKQIATLIEHSPVKKFIGVGQNMIKYSNFFNLKNSHFFISTEQLLNHLDSLNFDKEIILIKGARSFRFERISRRLQKKAYRTVLEINMNALRHNLTYFRSLLKPETKIMIMVKAFSYGSGSYEIASLLQAEGINYLGVAIADEAIELREAGITIPIIVMNPDIESINLFSEYSLEPEIYSFHILDVFYNKLKGSLHYQLPIHIKINTGMNRLGFDIDQINYLVEKLKKYSNVLKVASIFSHLAASPDEIFDNFTTKQLHEFENIVSVFKKNFGNHIIAHILNSAGIERFTEYQMDMVRLGIGLYGISAKDNNKLKQIASLKTHISQIRNIRKGQSVGYSRAQFVDRDSRIAILPIGYADGLNRRLSRGQGKVLIHNKLAPIIGNICMDMTMIDITDIPQAQEDDEVIIFGTDLPITTVAKWLDTIPYEVLTNISHRVKRIYTWE